MNVEKTTDGTMFIKGLTALKEGDDTNAIQLTVKHYKSMKAVFLSVYPCAVKDSGVVITRVMLGESVKLQEMMRLDRNKIDHWRDFVAKSIERGDDDNIHRIIANVAHHNELVLPT